MSIYAATDLAHTIRDDTGTLAQCDLPTAPDLLAAMLDDLRETRILIDTIETRLIAAVNQARASQ